MTYFIRARTHYEYAKNLLEEILSGKKKLTLNSLKDIFYQGLKALYAIQEIKPMGATHSVDLIFQKVIPLLREEEREKIEYLMSIFHPQGERENITLEERQLLQEVITFLRVVEECLKPIL